MIELCAAAGLGEHVAGHRPPTFGPTQLDEEDVAQTVASHLINCKKTS
jgi:hypothetical protein